MLRRTAFSFQFKLLSKQFIFPLLLSFCIHAGSVYSQNQQTPNPTEVTTLETGKPVEREISGGQKHIYKIALSADQYAKIIVEQRGIDITMRLESPLSKAIETDLDPRKIGVETFEFTSKTADTFTVTVWAKQKNAAPGQYQIRIAEIRAANEKDYALDEARRLHWETYQLWLVDKYDEALPLIKRAVEIRERELGAENSDLGSSLLMLANIYNDKGDYPTAEPIYLRSLAIKEKAFGKDDISLAAILNNLGNLYQDLGEYVKAEAVYERALKIREKHLEPNHLAIANVLINLGNVSRAKGDSERAAFYYQRVLEIREKALGLEHPEIATILNNLGNLFSDFEPGNVSKCEPIYLRALQIREKVFAPDNPQIGQTVFNLAVLYARAGDLTKALSFAQRALTIFEKSLGAEHPVAGMTLNLLATIYKNTGDYSQAETLYQRAVSIKRKTQGEYNPFLGGTYSNLAALYALKGEIEKAIDQQKRANAIVEFNTELNLTTGSEREKIEYMKTLRGIEDKTLTLGFQYAPESKEAAALSATMILQRKGRVLDAFSENLNALRRRFNPQDQALLDDLKKVNGGIAQLISQESPNSTSEAFQTKFKTLADKRETLEAEISRRARGFYEKSKPVVLPDVQSAIPPDAALLEFAVYLPASMSSVSDYDKNSTPRYAVFVLRANELKWKDLGEAKEINADVNAFRQALRDPKRKDAQQIARALDAKIMQPIRAFFGDAKHLLISPDGDLNLIPFEALTDENGRYQIENYSFTYLTGGRDLLRMQTARESKSKPLVIANPSFDLSNGGQTQIAKINSTTRKPGKGKRQSITATRNLSDVYFAPLGGTEQEARSIQTLFPEAEFLTGAQANESALKQTNAPRILHIATHGFFLQDAENSFSSSTRGGKPKTTTENPLLRSGLALAGANQRAGNASGDDGILTALEASGLNLWGTKLVVLSACDTGLGEVRNGEGVYGLRRAFVLAGTESLVMSLWSVSDYVTRELMTDYYKNLKQGVGRGSALRQVQLGMLKKSNRQHPFYWASFIQSGEWANLDGKR